MGRGFMIGIAESVVADSTLCFPDSNEFPRRMYGSLEDCLRAIATALKTNSTVTSVKQILYGEAFPFEDITFEQHLAKFGHAFYCNVEQTLEDEQEVYFSVAVLVVEY